MPGKSLNLTKMCLPLLSTRRVRHKSMPCSEKSSICETAAWQPIQPNSPFFWGAVLLMIYFQRIILRPLWAGSHISGYPLWCTNE